MSENCVSETSSVYESVMESPASSCDSEKEFPHTVPQPFSFAKRDEDFLKKKTELRQKAEKEYKMRPGSSLDSVASSNSDSKIPSYLKTTIPEPFSFATRDEILLKRKQEKIQLAAKEAQMRPKFTARPVPMFVTRSYSNDSLGSNMSYGSDSSEAVRSRKEIKEFNLATARRAEERKHFDEQVKEKQKVIEEWQKAEEEKREMKNREEVAILRANLVHKANPVKPYKEFKVLPSNKILTEPKTPTVLKRKKII